MTKQEDIAHVRFHIKGGRAKRLLSPQCGVYRSLNGEMQDISQTNRTNIFAIKTKVALQQSLEKFEKPSPLLMFAKTAKFYFAPASEKWSGKFMLGKVMLTCPAKPIAAQKCLQLTS